MSLFLFLFKETSNFNNSMSLSKREYFSFIYLLYLNIHIFYLLYIHHYDIWFIELTLPIYLITDTLWIIKDKHTKVKKEELVVHHVFTMILLQTTYIDNYSKILVLTIEFSTLCLLILRLLTNKILKKVVYYIFITSWVLGRIIWLFGLLIYAKYYNYSINNENYFIFICIYLLNIKWTLDVLKLTRFQSYSSVALCLPLLTLNQVFSMFEFTNLIILTLISFIHHSIKNKYTKAVDEFMIVSTTLYYLNFNLIIVYLISFIVLYIKWKYNNSILTRLIYCSAMIRHYYYFNIGYEILFVLFSFTIYIKYKYSCLWHISNGIYLTSVRKYLRYQYV